MPTKSLALALQVAVARALPSYRLLAAAAKHTPAELPAARRLERPHYAKRMAAEGQVGPESNTEDVFGAANAGTAAAAEAARR